MGSGDGAREGEPIPFEQKVVAWWQREEFVTLRDGTRGPRGETLDFIRRSRLETFDPVEPPLERPDEAVLSPCRQPSLPVVEHSRNHAGKLVSIRAARSSNSSVRSLCPTSCMPTGQPSAVRPAGRVIAG